MASTTISNFQISFFLGVFLKEIEKRIENSNELTITFLDFCDFLSQQGVRIGIETTKTLWETVKAEIKKIAMIMGYKIKQYSTSITIYKELPEEERKKVEEIEETLSFYGINSISLINVIFEYRTKDYFLDIIEKTPTNQELNEDIFISILTDVFSHLPTLVINDFYRFFLISKQHFLLRLSWHIRNLKSYDIQLEHITVTIKEIKKLYNTLQKAKYIEKEIKIGNKNFVMLSPKVVYDGFVKQLFFFLKKLKDKKEDVFKNPPIEIEERLRKEKDIESKIANLLNFLKKKYPIFIEIEELKKENFTALPIEIRSKCSLCNNLKNLNYMHRENEEMLICKDCFEKLPAILKIA
jgi:organic radical activating enzyme